MGRRVAVVGAGAVGCVLAVALVESGAEVVVCGRSPLEEITLTDDVGGTRSVPVSWASTPGDAGTTDAVVLATKIQDTPAVHGWLTALDGPVLVAQNGVDHAARVPAGLRVAPALIYVNAERTAPGVVRARRTEREIVLADDDAGREAAELLAPTWLRVDVVDDFTTAAWRKLLTNIGANPITALTGRRVEVLHDPAVAAAALSALEETAAVGRACGADLPASAAADTLSWLQALEPGSTSSMLQDRDAGRALEADGLTGAVIRGAEEHGVEVPTTRLLHALTSAVHS